LIEVASRTFYAHQNARTPLLTIFMTATLFVILAIPLARWLGAAGIALANSTAFTIQLVVMVWLINKQFPGFARVGTTMRRVLPVSVAAGLLVALCYQVLPFDTVGTLLKTTLAFGVLSGAGLLTLPFLWPEIKLLAKL
jgi:peptidoglycan biosynthesis protein MviN/MurJ (putative lipid II flippase)